MDTTASKIRNILKSEGGWTSKQISVRCDRGSSVNVTIKVPGISVARVKELAGQFERVSRCHYTHEILAGGNTFVFVSLDWEVISPLERKVAAWADTLPEDGIWVALPAEGLDIVVCRQNRIDFLVGSGEPGDRDIARCMYSSEVGSKVSSMMMQGGRIEFQQEAA